MLDMTKLKKNKPTLDFKEIPNILSEVKLNILDNLYENILQIIKYMIITFYLKVKFCQDDNSQPQKLI